MTEAFYIKPLTIGDALAAAKKCGGDYIYFGGGTDAAIYRKHRLSLENGIIDLNEIPEMKTIRVSENLIEIGSMVTLDEIVSFGEVVERLPLLAEAAASVASPVIRKSATIGGNLLVGNRCTLYNQSKEWRNAIGSCLKESGDICQVTGDKNKCNARNVSDVAAALIALSAEITVRNQNDTDTFDLSELYLPDGIYPHRDLGDDGIIMNISVPVKSIRWFFRKLRQRQSIDFSSLTVAAVVSEDNHARVCINSVSMAPVLIEGNLSQFTEDEVQNRARRECKIVDNDMMALSYRREMIGVYLRQWWQSIHDD